MLLLLAFFFWLAHLTIPTPIVVPVPVVVPTDPFQQLADCESGKDWQANTGNSFYGGLQFSLPTWISAGGLRFAPRPDFATEDEQIQIGREWLARTSWAQWPACSRKLGLS